MSLAAEPSTTVHPLRFATGRFRDNAGRVIDGMQDAGVALPAEARDVVCGMMVEIATARHSSEYQGRKYYFCAPSCKAQFEKNPDSFINT